MKGMVMQDKTSLKRDFEQAMDKSQGVNGGQDDVSCMTPFQNYTNKSHSTIVQSGTKSTCKGTTGGKLSTSKKPMVVSKMKPLKF